jgi:hypothetical protein
MQRAVHRFSPASLLLALLLFSSLPRTWFHHCAEEVAAWAATPHAAQVHTDGHCPICEAPFPVFVGGQPLAIGQVSLPLIDVLVFGERHIAGNDHGVERLRGPPVWI